MGQAEENGRTIRFLAMELIEGEDLQARLARQGALEVPEALDLGRQIAAALEVAHEAGVIHRDLKPANVRVTPQDRAVVVDFGLAKPTGSDFASESLALSASPTMAAPTVAGAILGTAPYMSPEQARGKPLDRRTDIWSFGCVLFEMLSGERAFRGETVSDTIAAVLREEPDWSRLPDGIPPATLGLLRRCLERDQGTRLRDIGEARVLLANGGTDPRRLEPPTPSLAGVPALRMKWAIPLGITLAVLGALLGGLLGRDDSPTAGTSARLVLPLSPSARLLPGQPPAISPDGRTIAYTAREGPQTQIYLRRLDRFDAVPVAGTENGERPFFSPDGEWVGFEVEGRLFKVATEGGTPTLLEQKGFWDPSAHWYKSDEIILGGSSASDHNGLMAVATDGSGSRPLTTVDGAAGESSHEYPHVLTDGTILFGVQTTRERRLARYWPEKKSWEYLELDAEPPAIVVLGKWLVYQSRSAVRAAAWDPERGTIEDPVDLFSVVGDAEWTVSPSGAATYLHAAGRGSRVVTVDRQGRSEALLDEVREYDWPRVSPDGSRIVVGHDVVGSAELWVYELDSGRGVQLRAPGSNGEPLWTPDGRRIAYSTDARTAGGPLHWQPADGSGVSELLHAEPFGMYPTSFSPSGGELAFYGVGGSDDGNAIWIVSLDGTGKTQARRVIDGPGSQRAGAFSPDGRWFAYSSGESGRSEIYLRPYPDLEERRYIVSREGGVDPHWSPDSDEIFYRNGDAMFVVEVSPDSEAVVGAPRELFRGQFHFQKNGDQSFDVFPDGERFLMIEPTPESRRELRVITQALSALE